uniref:G-protein coupled receptors family 1 profile domain-containing protein n=1 Tax=Anopheles epiroticus TaxID=199890 RepID=A0A182P438_9DIPT
MTVWGSRARSKLFQRRVCVWLWSVGVLAVGSQQMAVMAATVGSQANSVAVTPVGSVVAQHSGSKISVSPEEGLDGAWNNGTLMLDLNGTRHRQPAREDGSGDGLETGTVPVIELKRGQCRCWNSTEEAAGEVQCRCLGQSIVRVPQKLTGMQRLTLEKVGIKRLRTNALTVYADTLQDLFFIYLREFHRIEPAAFARLRHLRTLYIAHAPKLEFLPADVFEGISTRLKTLDLDGNQIRQIYERSIQLKTDELILDNNALTEIHGSAFHGSEIAKLSIKMNYRLKEIHGKAFVGISNIRELDLSGTAIEELPTEGLAELEILRIQHTHSLKTIPSVYNFKNLRTAYLTHSFHCCAFKFPARHDPDAHERNLKKFYEVQHRCIANGYSTPQFKLEVPSSAETPLVLDADGGDSAGTERSSRHHRSADFRHWFRLTASDETDDRLPHTAPLQKGIDLSDKRMGEIVDDSYLLPITGHPVDDAGELAIGGGLYTENPLLGEFHETVAQISSMEALCGNLTPMILDVQCYPMPDALNPCEDVMGSHWLRGSVWVVVLLAVFGNVAVVVVLFSNRSDLTVPKFLICNLAFADLCMGLYLLLIASIDAHSMGEYFNYAFDWQYGVGCKVAGFLTVFASHLSIFTLTIVTLERWFAITHAIYLNRRIKLSAAMYIMVIGWVYAITMAAMPLFGISNYSSTSICLPMEARDSLDIAYLLTVLVVNGCGFVVIVVCYAQIYLSLGKETRQAARSAHSGEMTVAKKMALLVFTNFACWAPIAFFGLTAIAGYPLIGVSKSKILLVFFYPLNSCANPYLYAILTVQYRKDLFSLLSNYGLCTQRAQQYKMTYSMPTNTFQVAPARGSVNYNSSNNGTLTSAAGMAALTSTNTDTVTTTVTCGSVILSSNGNHSNGTVAADSSANNPANGTSTGSGIVEDETFL